MKIYLTYFIFIILSKNLIAQSQVPNWTWVDVANGQTNARGNSIITDKNGNSYVTGYFSGTNVYFGNVSYSSGINSLNTYLFVEKVDSVGKVVWAKCGGSWYGAHGTFGSAITLDRLGNCYVTGSFGDTAVFDNDTIATMNGSGFIAKYDTSGNLIWLKGDGANAGPRGIVSDSIGNLYLTGNFAQSAIFGNDTIVCAGSSDIFIAKYDSSGSEQWVRRAGGNGFDYGYGISLFEGNCFYVTGSFQDSAIFGNDTLISSGSDDIFVAKYDTADNLIWLKKGGGTNYDIGWGVSSDKNGNCYVTGAFSGLAVFGIDTVSDIHNYRGIFIVKYDSQGILIWIKHGSGGNGVNEGKGVIIDNFSNCIVTGIFSNTGIFDSDTIIGHNNINGDIFVAKYDANGNLFWVKNAGGNSEDVGLDASFDNYGNCYITGRYPRSATFDTIIHSDPLTSNYNYFIGKIGCIGTQPEITLFNGNFHSTTATFYQWLLNGIIIHGATSQTYTPTQSGNYVVIGTDAGGCSASSLPYYYNAVDITETDRSNGISVYPDPSHDFFNFYYADETDPIRKIDIRDYLGKEIISTEKNRIDLREFADGIYFYSVRTKEGKIITGKVMKE